MSGYVGNIAPTISLVDVKLHMLEQVKCAKVVVTEGVMFVPGNRVGTMSVPWLGGKRNRH